MIPLHHDPHFTFRFGDDRLIPRFHLEGVEAGRRVDMFRIDEGGRAAEHWMVYDLIGLREQIGAYAAAERDVRHVPADLATSKLLL